MSASKGLRAAGLRYAATVARVHRRLSREEIPIDGNALARGDNEIDRLAEIETLRVQLAKLREASHVLLGYCEMRWLLDTGGAMNNGTTVPTEHCKALRAILEGD